MSAYDLETIVKKWGQAELTVEQVIGQLLQRFQALTARVGQLEKGQQEIRQKIKNGESSDAPSK